MATIPDHDRAAAILALRNSALELVVSNRMIFHFDSQALLTRHKAWSARHRPALHHAVELQTQIIVQPRCGMFLNDKRVAAFARDLAFWLDGYAEITFGPVALKT